MPHSIIWLEFYIYIIAIIIILIIFTVVVYVFVCMLYVCTRVCACARSVRAYVMIFGQVII